MSQGRLELGQLSGHYGLRVWSGDEGPVANDPYETWAKEPTRRRSVVISENMYFLGLTANRRVERHGLRRGGRGHVAWPDIDYVRSEF